MGREPRTLLEVCVARAGGGFRDIPKGSKVAMFVVEWAVASKALSKPLTTASFAEYWKVSERQVWRRRATFHELFPEREPQEVADLVVAEMERRGGTLGALVQVAL